MRRNVLTLLGLAAALALLVVLVGNNGGQEAKASAANAIDDVLLDANTTTAGWSESGGDPNTGTIGTVELCRAGLTAFSDSPTYLESKAGPLTEMKLTPLSFATALAASVFPHPGGPVSRIPFGGLTPAFSNSGPYFRGHSTASVSRLSRSS